MRALSAGVVARLVLVAAGLAACGDGRRPLPREEFVRKGNALCIELERRLDEAFKDVPAGAVSDPAKVQARLEKALPIFQDGLEQARDLGPPEGGEEEYEAWVKALERSGDRLEKATSSPEEAEKLVSDPGDPAFAEASRRAVALGLAECADPQAQTVPASAWRPRPGDPRAPVYADPWSGEG